MIIVFRRSVGRGVGQWQSYQKSTDILVYLDAIAIMNKLQKCYSERSNELIGTEEWAV